MPAVFTIIGCLYCLLLSRQVITANQDRFVQMLNEPPTGQAASGAGGLQPAGGGHLFGGVPQEDQGYITVTPEEKQAIDRVSFFIRSPRMCRAAVLNENNEEKWRIEEIFVVIMDDHHFNLFKKAQFSNHCLDHLYQKLVTPFWSGELGDINLTYALQF